MPPKGIFKIGPQSRTTPSGQESTTGSYVQSQFEPEPEWIDPVLEPQPPEPQRTEPQPRKSNRLHEYLSSLPLDPSEYVRNPAMGAFHPSVQPQPGGSKGKEPAAKQTTTTQNWGEDLPLSRKGWDEVSSKGSTTGANSRQGSVKYPTTSEDDSATKKKGSAEEEAAEEEHRQRRRQRRGW